MCSFQQIVSTTQAQTGHQEIWRNPCLAYLILVCSLIFPSNATKWPAKPAVPRKFSEYSQMWLFNKLWTHSYATLLVIIHLISVWLLSNVKQQCRCPEEWTKIRQVKGHKKRKAFQEDAVKCSKITDIFKVIQRAVQTDLQIQSK